MCVLCGWWVTIISAVRMHLCVHYVLWLCAMGFGRFVGMFMQEQGERAGGERGTVFNSVMLLYNCLLILSESDDNFHKVPFLAHPDQYCICQNNGRLHKTHSWEIEDKGKQTHLRYRHFTSVSARTHKHGITHSLTLSPSHPPTQVDRLIVCFSSLL